MQLKNMHILTIDGDGQHPKELIPKFIKYIEQNKYKVMLEIGNFSSNFRKII